MVRQASSPSPALQLPLHSNGSKVVRHGDETWKELKFLGAGGFGSVFLQKCISGYSKGRLRAVKQIYKPKQDGGLDQDTIRELDALTLLSSPKYENLFVKMKGWYQDDSSLYIAMEYLPLGDLANYLFENGPLLEHTAITVVGQILKAVNAMHGENLAHRDIKPSNVLISRCPPNNDSWQIKISDFGLSKQFLQSRTMSSATRGTIGFMPPESLGMCSAEGLSQMQRAQGADIWAVGETVVWILTSKPSFGDNMPLLCDYARGRASFPSAQLQANGMSLHSVQYAKLLMDPDPRRRTSASHASDHHWLRPGSHRVRDATFRRIRTFRTNGRVGLAFSPDGEAISIVSPSELKANHIKAGHFLYSFSGQYRNGLLEGAAYTPYGDYIAVTGRNGRHPFVRLTGVPLIKAGAPAQARWLDCKHKSEHKLTISRNGEMLLLVCEPFVYLFHIDGDHLPKDRYQRFHVDSPILDVAFTTNSRELVFAGNSNVTRLSATTFQINSSYVYPSKVTSTAVSPCGHRFAGADDECIYIMLGGETGWKVTSAPDDGVQSMAWSPDNRWLAICTRQDEVLIKEVKAGRVDNGTRTRSLGMNSGSHCVFSTDSRRLAAYSPVGDGKVFIWQIE